MRSIEEAQHLVLEVAARLEKTALPLAESLGLVLSEDVTSDIDMPPFHKALLDGFAVRSQDLAASRGMLAIVGEIFAGQSPWPSDRILSAGQAVRIMTGAPIPPGADAVVMIEHTSQGTGDGGQGSGVRIDEPRLRPGQNIMPCGTEMTRGQQVLKAGTRIRPAEVGLLAAVGRATVPVYTRPGVAIISTGNEIVAAHETPGPGQIRNSNGPTLAALVTRAGGVPQYLGIARDTNDDLRRLVRQGMQADVLLLSGGVSVGELDLVPGVLREFGVREVFHKVNLKPGKPVWFGVVERRARSVERSEQASRLSSDHSGCSTLNAERSTLVFGLPGNPVSVVVCFELFVRPAIRRLMGLADPGPKVVRAALTENRDYRSDRPTYWPAWLEQAEDGFRVRLVAWKGSPDLRAMTEANAFAILPPGERQYRAGERIRVLTTDY